MQPPKSLSERSQGIWNEVLVGWDLGPDECEVLRLALEVLDRYDAARKAVERDGMLVPGRYAEKQLVVHPLLAVERDLRLAYARLVRQLGLADAVPAKVSPLQLTPRRVAR